MSESGEEQSRCRKHGILRAETGKSRSSSAVSVEFKDVEPTSPLPSADRLSVSFANDEKKVEEEPKVRASITDNENEEEEDEYSVSANAILERNRDSWKRRSSKRRASSPFSPPSDPIRRKSSVFTISSAENSADEVATQNMRIHKEVVAQVKYQAWPMRRKLKLVQQAKTYIKLHEGQIQERLAHNRSTRDVLAHIKILFLNYWNYFRREISNILNNMIPWEHRIKEIESHFGSAVASYFTFHRWLFSVNLKIAVLLLILVMLPEVFFAKQDPSFSGERKLMLPEEKQNSKTFVTLWNFEGVLKHSAIFYGYYNSRNSNRDSSFKNKLPLLYFISGLGVYVYSFIAILRKMADNSRQSKLTEKDEDCIFTWKLFTSWDFMIGNPETANNRISSIILGFKEALLEEAEKTREEKRNWKLFTLRIFTHITVLLLLGTSMYVVIYFVGRSLDKKSGWWQQNEVTIAITLIGMIYPVIFDMIGYVEKYHPRKALRIQLARIMVLNLLTLYSFIFATFSNIGKISALSNCTKPNSTMIKRYKGLEAKNKLKSIATHLVATSIIASRSVAPPINNLVNLMHDPSELFLGGINLTPLNRSFPIFNNNDEQTINNNIPQNVIYKSQYFGITTESPTNDIFSSDIVGYTTSIYNVTTPNIMDEIYNISSTVNSTTYTDGYENVNMSSTTDSSEFDTNDDTTFSITVPVLNDIYTDDYSQPATESSSTPTENNSDSNNLITTTDSYFTNFFTTVEEKSSELQPASSVTISNSNPTEPFTPNRVTTEIIGVTQNTFVTDNPKVISTALGLETNDSFCKKEIEQMEDVSPYARFLDKATRKRIHELCWETMFGQELVKLTVMDLVMTAGSILMIDFFRALFVRFMNSCWCWDLEKTFPQYGDFKIAENILHLVNNQGMVWMGMFFSPGLPLINVLKLIILMYLRSWAVLTCNVPHEVVFRASRSNNFYFALLLTMLFLCVLPVGYALVRIETSWHCGPFSSYNKIYFLFTTSLKSVLPESIRTVLDYVASPGIVIPLLVLLILIIYYLISLTSALREANDDLKIQLRRERTEERRKVFQMANKRKKGLSHSESPFNKWYKLMNASMGGKNSIDFTPIIMNEKTHHKPTKNPTFKEPHDDLLNSPVDNNQNAKKDIERRESSNSDVFRDREDSVISGWSVDNIPEIRIIQSASDISQKSPEVLSQSKSSSKETIINVEPDKDNSKATEEVISEESNDTNGKIISKSNEEKIENDNGILKEDIETESDDKGSKSMSEETKDDNGALNKTSPKKTDASEESRKNFAKIIVDSLKK